MIKITASVREAMEWYKCNAVCSVDVIVRRGNMMHAKKGVGLSSYCK